MCGDVCECKDMYMGMCDDIDVCVYVCVCMRICVSGHVCMCVHGCLWRYIDVGGLDMCV